MSGVDHLLPLKSADAQILIALGSGPAYAYRIAGEIARETNGVVRLEAGNLHRTLRKLERDGLVEVCPPPTHEAGRDPRRVYYRLTSLGRAAMRADLGRLREMVRSAERAGLLPRADEA